MNNLLENIYYELYWQTPLVFVIAFLLLAIVCELAAINDKLKHQYHFKSDDDKQDSENY